MYIHKKRDRNSGMRESCHANEHASSPFGAIANAFIRYGAAGLFYSPVLFHDYSARVYKRPRLFLLLRLHNSPVCYWQGRIPAPD
ncbi:hypothetical protein CEXT_313881 [Caerostris extrusa]|uniref:Uncharacterized protein n=1 Tax=Caerostris extrusa TaxID=172846 RepID=A0AAV4QF20_CAEEX|nr:hypothetical protein CEXT_313881 [Caerostris extrusa]